MSIPIKSCRFAKAATNEKAYEALLRDLKYNLKHGAYTLVGCDHDPPCSIVESDGLKLADRLEKDLELDD